MSYMGAANERVASYEEDRAEIESVVPLEVEIEVSDDEDVSFFLTGTIFVC